MFYYPRRRSDRPENHFANSFERRGGKLCCSSDEEDGLKNSSKYSRYYSKYRTNGKKYTHSCSSEEEVDENLSYQNMHSTNSRRLAASSSSYCSKKPRPIGSIGLMGLMRHVGPMDLKGEKELSREQSTKREKVFQILIAQLEQEQQEKNTLQQKVKEQEERLAHYLSSVKIQDQEDNKEDNKEDTAKQCIICMDALPTHIAIPCGHQVYCENCIQKLKKCAICRKEITNFYKVYS